MTMSRVASSTVTYQYDLAGRRTQMTWPDSFYDTSYDNANDVTPENSSRRN